MKQRTNLPPEEPRYFLEVIIPEEFKDVILGDLNDNFLENVSKHGIRFANLYFWMQALKLVLEAFGIPIISFMILSSILKIFPFAKTIARNASQLMLAESFLCFFLPKSEQEEVIGAMHARYNRELPYLGEKKALRNFWKETLKEIFPFSYRFISSIYSIVLGRNRTMR